MTKFKIPKEIIAVFLIVLSLFFSIFIPITFALGKDEIRNPDISFQIFLFSAIGIVGALVILMIYFSRRLWSQDNKYGNAFGFVETIDNPISRFLNRFTKTQQILYFTIITSTMFLIANATGRLKQGFTGILTLPQQFSPGESLAFSTLLIPGNEELFSLAVIAILVLALVLIAIKTNMSKANFLTYYFLIIPILIGFFAVQWHGSAYPGSDIAKAIVFFFWFIKTEIILLTGNYLLGDIFHRLNNFFIDFQRVYSSDLLVGSVIAGIIILSIITYFLYKDRLFGKVN